MLILKRAVIVTE